MRKPKRKTYSREFIEEAVKLTEAPGHTIEGVAADLGVPASTLAGWRVRLLPKPEEQPVPIKAEDLERQNERLRKRVAELEEEKLILKKATAFFAKESR